MRRSCLLFLVFALAGLHGWLASARAAEIDQAVARFAGDSFADTEAAVGDVASSGDPRAAEIVAALSDGRLVVGPDRRVLLRDKGSGALVEAASGIPIAGAAPAPLKTVRLNNRVRRAIDAAMGALTLMAPDPDKRIEAAQAVFKSRDQGALPALDKALARETDPRVKAVFETTRAALVVTDPSASEENRVAAIAPIRDRGDQEAAALLRSLPADSPQSVRSAATAAVKAIESRLALWASLQNVVFGVSLGSVLLLAAVGLAITFGVMGVINMAHGEMIMVGAYSAFVVQEIFRAWHVRHR